MSIPDIATLRKTFRPSDVPIALALLTRLPMPYSPSATRPPSAAAWAYPVVGLIVGVIALAVGWVIQTLGASAPITAFFVLLSMIVTTGAMHEDGLADCADGFWGGWTFARRLEIMKDSQVGSYGAIALAMSLFLRWYALTLMIDKGALVAGVLVAAVMSRAAMVVVMYQLPNARKSGLSAQTGRPGGVTTIAALVIGLAAAILAPDISFVWLIFWAVLATIGAGWIAHSKIGGQTGDVLGATQQGVEITILVAFDMMISG